VKEVEEDTQRSYVANYSAGLVSNTIGGGGGGGRADTDDSLDFTPIRLRYVIQAKFEIE